MMAEELAARVQACDLAASAFRHVQHVQLGWHYLRTYPLLTAVTTFATVLQRFAVHHGAHRKYDERITVSYMLLIEERRRDDPSADWSTFAARNADLIDDGMGLPCISASFGL